MDMWPLCTQQRRQRKQIIAVGQETMALATGNIKWWCDKSNNVTALSFTQICFVHGCTDERDQLIPDAILLQYSVATKAVLIQLIGKQQWRQPNEAVQPTRDAWVK
jgi:hypothetical protein